MNRFEIFAKQAANLPDEALLEALAAATEPAEVRALETELEGRTSPYGAGSQRSLLADLLAGGGLFA